MTLHHHEQCHESAKVRRKDREVASEGTGTDTGFRTDYGGGDRRHQGMDCPSRSPTPCPRFPIPALVSLTCSHCGPRGGSPGSEQLVSGWRERALVTLSYPGLVP